MKTSIVGRALTSMAAVALSALFLVACSKSDDQSANLEMNAGCYLMQTSGTGGCNYNYSASPGFTEYYPTTMSTSAYAYGTSLGCSGYFAATYSERKGLGCVDSSAISYHGRPVMYTYNPGSSTFVITNNDYNYAYSYPTMSYGYDSYSSIPVNASQLFHRTCANDEPCAASQRCINPTGAPGANGLGICFY